MPAPGSNTHVLSRAEEDIVQFPTAAIRTAVQECCISFAAPVGTCVPLSAAGMHDREQASSLRPFACAHSHFTFSFSAVGIHSYIKKCRKQNGRKAADDCCPSSVRPQQHHDKFVF